jgi:hypothetical protein
MSGHWVCKICIERYGLKGRELSNWPLEDDLAGIVHHLWDKHGVAIRNDGESEEDCKRRYEATPP